MFPGQCARLLMAMTGRTMPETPPTAKDARSARRWCCCVLLAVLWCASLPLACLPGPVPVAVADVWQALGAVVGLCPPADQLRRADGTDLHKAVHAHAANQIIAHFRIPFLALK